MFAENMDNMTPDLVISSRLTGSGRGIGLGVGVRAGVVLPPKPEKRDEKKPVALFTAFGAAGLGLSVPTEYTQRTTSAFMVNATKSK